MVQGKSTNPSVIEETVQTKVPKYVKRQLVMLVTEKSETHHTVILRALENLGVQINAEEILDRRKSR